MCVVSAVTDNQNQRFPIVYPTIWPSINLNAPKVPENIPSIIDQSNPVTRAEFEALKRDLEELKKVLVAAKKYDDATGQPECEQEEKVALLKRLAKLTGVDIDEVFK